MIFFVVYLKIREEIKISGHILLLGYANSLRMQRIQLNNVDCHLKNNNFFYKMTGRENNSYFFFFFTEINCKYKDYNDSF